MDKSRLDALLADSDSDDDSPAGSTSTPALTSLSLGNALLDDSDDSEEESDMKVIREQMAALGAAKQRAASTSSGNESVIEASKAQHDDSEVSKESESLKQAIVEAEPSGLSGADNSIPTNPQTVVEEEQQETLRNEIVPTAADDLETTWNVVEQRQFLAAESSLHNDPEAEPEGIREDEATTQQATQQSAPDPHDVTQDTVKVVLDTSSEGAQPVDEDVDQRSNTEEVPNVPCTGPSPEMEGNRQELAATTQEATLHMATNAVADNIRAETVDEALPPVLGGDNEGDSGSEARDAQDAASDPLHAPSKSQGLLAAEEAMVAMGLALPSLSPGPSSALASPLPAAPPLPPSLLSPTEREASSAAPPLPQNIAQTGASSSSSLLAASPTSGQPGAPRSISPLPTPPRNEVAPSEADPGQSVGASPPPPKTATASTPVQSPSIPSMSTPTLSSPVLAAAEKAASSRGHTTMARLLAERQHRDEQELRRQQQQSEIPTSLEHKFQAESSTFIEPVPMASLEHEEHGDHEESGESKEEGSSGFAFIAAESTAPSLDALHSDASLGMSSSVRNERANFTESLSGVDNFLSGGSNHGSRSDHTPLSPRAGPPQWHELPLSDAPQQLGFRPASASVDGLCLRRIEITWALDASWDDFCDVARTVFMSRGLRTFRPHVAQLCVTRSENHSSNSSNYDHRGGGGDVYAASKGAQSVTIPGYGTLAQWGLLRCTIGVTAQRLRTVVLEVCTRPLPGGPAAHAAAQALLDYSNNSSFSNTESNRSNVKMSGSSSSSSFGGGSGGGSGGSMRCFGGEEAVAVLRDAMRGFCLPDDRDNNDVQNGNDGRGGLPFSGASFAPQPSSSLTALANQAASAPLRLTVGLDPLYVLQVFVKHSSFPCRSI